MERDIVNFQKVHMIPVNPRLNDQLLTRLFLWKRMREKVKNVSFSASKDNRWKMENFEVCESSDRQPAPSYRDLYRIGQDFNGKSPKVRGIGSEDTKDSSGKCGQERKINSTEHEFASSNNRRLNSRRSSTGNMFQQKVPMSNVNFKEKKVWDPVMNFQNVQLQKRQEKCNKRIHFKTNQQVQSDGRDKARGRSSQQQENQQHQDDMD